MIGEPRGAPLGSDMVVTAGSIGIVHVWGDRIYNTNRTRSLNPKERRCLFADESSTGMGTKYYLRRNCKTACYLNHLVKHCGCYLEFMFGLMHRKYIVLKVKKCHVKIINAKSIYGVGLNLTLNETNIVWLDLFSVTENDSLRPCNVEDLLCLSEKNSKRIILLRHNIIVNTSFIFYPIFLEFFKSLIPSENNAFMTNDMPGLKCNCMPDCVHQMYISELTIAEPSISTVL